MKKQLTSKVSSEIEVPQAAREDVKSDWQRVVRRRSFLKGLGAASATLPAAALLTNQGKAASGRLTRGDVAILRFLAAAELIESDLWQQYNELGGVTGGNAAYQLALQNLDGDMPQYISDNTDDEISHANFLNAYLKSKGEEQVNLDQFRRLPGSQAAGADPKLQNKRLTNLLKLNVDTSWWTRYRSGNQNPDLGDSFPNAVPTLASGKFPAIPRNNAELGIGVTTLPVDNHVQAIANTAGFHFGFIEQGGTSLYAAMAQKVTSLEVMRVVLSIGGTEIMHFQTWHDKAGNAKPLTDGALVFPDLTTNKPQPESLQSNLIMPEPTVFLSKKFPVCSIIRPTAKKAIAMSIVNDFRKDGLFIGQTPDFLEFFEGLAQEADAAERELER